MFTGEQRSHMRYRGQMEKKRDRERLCLILHRDRKGRKYHDFQLLLSPEKGDAPLLQRVNENLSQARQLQI